MWWVQEKLVRFGCKTWREKTIWDLGVDKRTVLKWMLNNYGVAEYVLHSTGSGQTSVAGCHRHYNERLSSVTGNFLTIWANTSFARTLLFVSSYNMTQTIQFSNHKLCINKGKVFLLLNQVPRHEDVYGSEGIANTPRPLYPRGKSTRYPWIGGREGPRARVDAVAKGKVQSLPPPGI
jgi:hypothetical protein